MSGHTSLALVEHPGSSKFRTSSCLMICQRQVCLGSIVNTCDQCMMQSGAVNPVGPDVSSRSKLTWDAVSRLQICAESVPCCIFYICCCLGCAHGQRLADQRGAAESYRRTRLFRPCTYNTLPKRQGTAASLKNSRATCACVRETSSTAERYT